jgi:hypothetical protein
MAMEWWSNLDPDTQQALILAGSGAASGYLNNRAEEGRQDDVRRDSAITNQAEGIQSVMNSEAGDFQFNANRNDSNATNAAQMAGKSPLQFQGDRARMSALNDVLKGAGRTSFTGMPDRYSKHMPSGMNTSAFSATTHGFMDPGAMAAAEKPYWAAQQNIDPRLKAPDLGAMGYGTAGQGVTADLEEERSGRLDERASQDTAYHDNAKQRREALLAALQGLGPDGTNPEDEDDGGSDWWKTALGVGAGVAGGYLGGR